MARRLHQTLADYLVIAISPALIMALVGSLVFFLLGVFYQGQFQERLHWVMACFVFAAVLIARIAIEEGYQRAVMFGGVLAVLVAIASNRFMELQGGWIGHFGFLINWGLIALIWWCVDRLTWDCTVIDDSQDASGEGLLQVAGLERDKDKKSSASAKPVGSDTDPLKLEGTTSRIAPAGLWQRYLEHQRRPHAPGVWVVYFSLAALPLFGIGQWFIPESDVMGRRRAFWLLVIYVAAGIGLLLTTSFLGLRRYLRQRRIEMPTRMANLWLGTGCVMIAALLVLAALLPRPSAEYAISQLPVRLGSPEQHGSRKAPVNQDGADNPEEKGAAPETEGDKSESGEASDSAPPPAGSSDGQDSDGATASSKQDQPQGDSNSSSGSSDAKGKGKGGRSAEQNQKSRPSQAPVKSSQNDPSKSASSDERQQRSDSSDAQQEETSDQPPAATKSPEATAERPQANDKPSGESGEPKSADAPSETSNPADNLDTAAQALQSAAEAAGWATELLKWAIYALLGLAAAYSLWRFRAEVLSSIAEFMAGLRNWLARLFGGGRRPALATADAAEIVVPPQPFSSFADPFASGIAPRYSLAELTRYSFEAFEAWSREHNCPRQPDRTPHELVQTVSKRHKFIAAEAKQLAELYARAAYARGDLPATAREELASLWIKMRQSAAAEPVSIVRPIA